MSLNLRLSSAEPLDQPCLFSKLKHEVDRSKQKKQINELVKYLKEL